MPALPLTRRTPTHENAIRLRWCAAAAAVAAGGRTAPETWSNWSTRTGGKSTMAATLYVEYPVGLGAEDALFSNW